MTEPLTLDESTSTRHGPCRYDSSEARWVAFWSFPCLCPDTHPSRLCDEHAATIRWWNNRLLTVGGWWGCSDCHTPGRLASLERI